MDLLARLFRPPDPVIPSAARDLLFARWAGSEYCKYLMIQPIKKSRELLAEIEAQGPEDGVALWWLGQSGFVLKWLDAVLFVDPYLSEHLTAKYAATARPHVRMTEAPFRGADVGRADLVLATHKHSDHLDPGTVPDILKNTGARLVLPRALVEHAAAMGLERARLIPADAGRAIQYGLPGGRQVVIHPVPAAHEQLDWSERDGYPYLGYVIQLGDCTLYHAGDCVPYSNQLDWLRPFRLDAALLPINGRDAARGVPGNFTIAEAAELAEAAGAAWLVPMHYDMFTFNTVDVSDFAAWMAARHPRQKFNVLRCGERWRVKSGSPGAS